LSIGSAYRKMSDEDTIHDSEDDVDPNQLDLYNLRFGNIVNPGGVDTTTNFGSNLNLVSDGANDDTKVVIRCPKTASAAE